MPDGALSSARVTAALRYTGDGAPTVVAAGRGIVVLPLSTITFYTRPDVTYARIDDIAANQVCLAWLAGRRDPLIGEFAAGPGL